MLFLCILYLDNNDSMYILCNFLLDGYIRLYPSIICVWIKLSRYDGYNIYTYYTAYIWWDYVDTVCITPGPRGVFTSHLGSLTQALSASLNLVPPDLQHPPSQRWMARREGSIHSDVIPFLDSVLFVGFSNYWMPLVIIAPVRLSCLLISSIFRTVRL